MGERAVSICSRSTLRYACINVVRTRCAILSGGAVRNTRTPQRCRLVSRGWILRVRGRALGRDRRLQFPHHRRRSAPSARRVRQGARDRSAAALSAADRDRSRPAAADGAAARDLSRHRKPATAEQPRRCGRRAAGAERRGLRTEFREHAGDRRGQGRARRHPRARLPDRSARAGHRHAGVRPPGAEERPPVRAGERAQALRRRAGARQARLYRAAGRRGGRQRRASTSRRAPEPGFGITVVPLQYRLGHDARQAARQLRRSSPAWCAPMRRAIWC